MSFLVGIRFLPLSSRGGCLLFLLLLLLELGLHLLLDSPGLGIQLALAGRHHLREVVLGHLPRDAHGQHDGSPEGEAPGPAAHAVAVPVGVAGQRHGRHGGAEDEHTACGVDHLEAGRADHLLEGLGILGTESAQRHPKGACHRDQSEPAVPAGEVGAVVDLLVDVHGEEAEGGGSQPEGMEDPVQGHLVGSRRRLKERREKFTKLKEMAIPITN